MLIQDWQTTQEVPLLSFWSWLTRQEPSRSLDSHICDRWRATLSSSEDLCLLCALYPFSLGFRHSSSNWIPCDMQRESMTFWPFSRQQLWCILAILDHLPKHISCRHLGVPYLCYEPSVWSTCWMVQHCYCKEISWVFGQNCVCEIMYSKNVNPL